MKKFFLFAAAAIAAMTVNAETLVFDADTAAHKTAGAWSDGYTWELETFDVTLVDTKAKMTVDANNAYFGTADQHIKLQSRLKSGGKSAASGENSIEIEVYEAGKLSIAVRTGSNSATDRTLVVTQSGTELFNQVIQESDAVEVEGLDKDDPTKKTKIYPIITCNVGVGTVVLTYPVGSMNFYAFAIGDIEIPEPQGIENAAATVKAVKTFENGQLVIIKNGVKYNALGAQL